jgi:hypothetical protein
VPERWRIRMHCSELRLWPFVWLGSSVPKKAKGRQQLLPARSKLQVI